MIQFFNIATSDNATMYKELCDMLKYETICSVKSKWRLNTIFRGNATGNNFIVATVAACAQLC